MESRLVGYGIDTKWRMESMLALYETPDAVGYMVGSIFTVLPSGIE